MENTALETKHGLVVLRAAVIADAGQFRELRLDALQDCPTAFPADYSTNVDQPMHYWENRLHPDDLGTIFVAVHKNQLIGMTGIRRGESSKTKHSATIWGVYVRPAWRGLRIADALITMCARWATQNNVNILKLGVLAGSEAAIRCYERCGFTISGTEPRGIFYDGKYYDGYFMFRLLDDTQ